MVTGTNQEGNLSNTGIKKVPINVMGFPARLVPKREGVSFPATKFFTGIVANESSALPVFFKKPQA